MKSNSGKGIWSMWLHIPGTSRSQYISKTKPNSISKSGLANQNINLEYWLWKFLFQWQTIFSQLFCVKNSKKCPFFFCKTLDLLQYFDTIQSHPVSLKRLGHEWQVILELKLNTKKWKEKLYFILFLKHPEGNVLQTRN